MSPIERRLLRQGHMRAGSFLAERKARAPLPAEAHVDHGVEVVITGNHRN